MINHAWPKEELDERTIAFADRFANMTADHLAICKVNMNRFYENMGIYSFGPQLDRPGRDGPVHGRERTLAGQRARSDAVRRRPEGSARLARRPYKDYRMQK
jgi:hypothetical protein